MEVALEINNSKIGTLSIFPVSAYNNMREKYGIRGHGYTPPILVDYKPPYCKGAEGGGLFYFGWNEIFKRPEPLRHIDIEQVEVWQITSMNPFTYNVLTKTPVRAAFKHGIKGETQETESTCMVNLDGILTICSPILYGATNGPEGLKFIYDNLENRTSNSISTNRKIVFKARVAEGLSTEALNGFQSILNLN